MKKVIILLFLTSVVYFFSIKDEIVIPKESIRFRIIANSNSIEDQALKNRIKSDLIDNILPNTVKETYSSSEVLIAESIPKIKESLNKYNVNYRIDYGNNYFPQQQYKGITYPKGKYKSLVITLDSGLGDNYWCVLYPPLCLVKEDNNTTNIEYKSLIKEVLNNFNI